MTALEPHIRPTGVVLGAYRVERLLGEGGMANVYLAEHVKLGRKVAIKLLLPELAERDDIAQRFFAEARAVNAIHSEHIVDITDFVETGNEKYFVMEVLDGPNLRELMSRGPLPLERVFDIALQLARTLEVVHAAGILHRDLKPDNVMLVERAGRRDWVKLLDFGIAKFMDEAAFEASGMPVDTSDGAVLGTPAYLAPELLRGVAPDFRADVYSFGLLLHQMVTGQRPFAAKSLPELIHKQLHEEAPRLSSLERPPYPIPEDLDSLVRRCLEKARELRPPTMSHVVAELEMIGTQLGLSVGATWGSFDEATASRTPHDLTPVVATRSLTSPRVPPSRRLVAVAVVLLGAALFFVGESEPPVAALAEAPPPLPPEPEIPEEDPRLARIDDGEAEAVLAALNKSDRLSPSDELIRGHALFALGNARDAWRAYDAAVGAREVDDRLLERALAALEERKADAAMDVLASWPNDGASKALKRLLSHAGWWPRHHALKILDDRGEATNADKESVAVLDVDTGPSCGTRRYGVKQLKAHGRDGLSLGALDRAAKRPENGCLKSQLRSARAAIRARMAAIEEGAATASPAPDP